MATSETITYKGIEFRRYPESRRVSHRNYFRPHAGHIRAGIGHLHQEIWKDANGPIPAGHEIHHKDGNPLNNDLSNLECLTVAEHRHKQAELWGGEISDKKRAHLDRVRPLASDWHRSDEGRKWHSEHAKEGWRDKKPKLYTCIVCGAEFGTIAAGNKHGIRFCSRLCAERERSASRRRLKEKQCPVCGKSFLGQSRQQNCSRECGARARWDRQKAGT